MRKLSLGHITKRGLRPHPHCYGNLEQDQDDPLPFTPFDRHWHIPHNRAAWGSFFGFFPPTSFADSACENALSKQNVIRPQPSPLFHFGQLQKINIDKQTKYDIF